MFILQGETCFIPSITTINFPSFISRPTLHTNIVIIADIYININKQYWYIYIYIHGINIYMYIYIIIYRLVVATVQNAQNPPITWILRILFTFQDGVYTYGLFFEACRWNWSEWKLAESEPKVLYATCLVCFESGSSWLFGVKKPHETFWVIFVFTKGIFSMWRQKGSGWWWKI